MRKIGSIAVMGLMMLGTSTVFGQDVKQKPTEEQRQERHDKMEAQKKEFFQKELELTDEESEKFYALYSQYVKDKRQNQGKIREVNKNLHDKSDSLTDKEIRSNLDAVYDFEIDQLQLKKKFMSRGAEIIGYKKMLKFSKVEMKFRHEGQRPSKDKSQLKKDFPQQKMKKEG